MSACACGNPACAAATRVAREVGEAAFEKVRELLEQGMHVDDVLRGLRVAGFALSATGSSSLVARALKLAESFDPTHVSRN